MPYKATAIANYFLFKAKCKGLTINPMQIQRLVYIAHGWNLAFYDKPLIKEPVEAWRYAPTIHSLFKAFRKYGASPIDEYADNADMEYNFDKNTLNLMNIVLDKYGKKDTVEMSVNTQGKNSPWREMHDKKDESLYGKTISNEKIKNQFIQLKNKAGKK